MSWVWPEYVSRDLPLSEQERKTIRRNAWRLWWADKRNVLFYLVVPTFYLFTVFFASDVGGWVAALLGARGMIHKLFRAAAPIVLFVLCFVMGGALLQRYRFAPCVYGATRQQGCDVCARCGYWLRGLSDDIERCPECGAKREPMPGSEPEKTPSS